MRITISRSDMAYRRPDAFDLDCVLYRRDNLGDSELIAAASQPCLFCSFWATFSTSPQTRSRLPLHSFPICSSV